MSCTVIDTNACGDGGLKYGGACYFFIPETGNFDFAKKKCTALRKNSQLAVVSSAAMSKVLQKFIRTKVANGYNDVWIDGTYNVS